MTNPTRQIGEAVAWVLTHPNEPDAIFMGPAKITAAGWSSQPLIPASDLSTITRQRDEARDENARWLLRLADIREAAGVSAKPMLSELPEAIATIRHQRDEAVRLLREDAKPYWNGSGNKCWSLTDEAYQAFLATVEDKP